MGHQIEKFQVMDAQLVHANSSTGRIEFKLAGGRVATLPCDIEQKRMTGETEETASPTGDEFDEALESERAAHEAADEARRGEHGEPEDDLLAREREAHERAEEESRRLDEERRKREEEEAARTQTPPTTE